MKKTIRYIMYAVILIICATSIFVAIYSLEAKNGQLENTVIGENDEGKTEEQISTTEKFKQLFNNNVSNLESINKDIKKINADKPIVYEEGFSEEQNGKYSIAVHLPIININSQITNGYNTATSQNFATKVGMIKSAQQVSDFTIYETSYTGFVNNDILSIAIMASLKQGNNAQRIIVQTYNYNLSTGKEVKINDIIQNRGLDTTAVNKKINSEIRKAQETAESVSQTGYDVYKRNLDNEMYNISNVNSFIQGPDGELYIIYAYGNTNNTSEIDVIQI